MSLWSAGSQIGVFTSIFISRDSPAVGNLPITSKLQKTKKITISHTDKNLGYASGHPDLHFFMSLKKDAGLKAI